VEVPTGVELGGQGRGRGRGGGGSWLSWKRVVTMFAGALIPFEVGRCVASLTGKQEQKVDKDGWSREGRGGRQAERGRGRGLAGRRSFRVYKRCTFSKVLSISRRHIVNVLGHRLQNWRLEVAQRCIGRDESA
jgi:hypothetical protein